MKRLSKKTGEDFSFRGERLVCVNESGDKIPTDARVGKWAGQEWHTLLSPGVVKAAYQHFAVDFAQLGINLLNQPTYGQWWEDGSVEAAYQQRVLVTR